MKHSDPLIIKPAEMMAVLKYSKSKTYRTIKAIRSKLKKQSPGFITVDNFCAHIGESEENVRLIIASLAAEKRQRKKSIKKNI